MSKRNNKIKMAVLVLIIGGGLTGCTPPESGEVIDTSKTQLQIAIGDNGVGTEFLYNLKAEFEKENSDVQVIINNRDAELSNGLEYLKTAVEDIIYMNGVDDYYSYQDYMYDFTDMLNKKAYDSDGEYLKEENGSKSLADKLKIHEQTFNMFNCGTKDNPKFLSIPWFSALYGIWYDADLFEEDGLYNLPDYKGLDGIAFSGDEGYGPDGVEGTYDDGLPSTWEDMKILLKTMQDTGIVPFTFSGMHAWMRNSLLLEIMINYEGINDFLLNYSFSGTDSQYGEINSSNGWKIKKQEGKLAALLFAEEVAKNQMYSNGSLKLTQTHLQAQTEYLDSVTTSSRSAFLIDGSWWEYEARDTFAKMGKINSKFAKGNRTFKFLPIPKFVNTDGISNQENNTTYVSNISDYSIIGNKNTKNAELVEKFLLFAHSKTNLKNFTNTTNLFTEYECPMTKEDLQKLTPLARNAYEIINDKNVQTYSANNKLLTVQGMTLAEANQSLRAKNNSFFDNFELTTKINNTVYNDPIRDMAYDKNNVVTAQSWYDGYYNIMDEEKWSKYFK